MLLTLMLFQVHVSKGFPTRRCSNQPAKQQRLEILLVASLVIVLFQIAAVKGAEQTADLNQTGQD